MRRVMGCLGFLALLILMIPIASAAPTEAWHPSQTALLTFVPPSIVSEAPVANSWTHLGCWTPQLSSPCLDVYQDAQGGLWICKACGTTGNPGPGKCRRTTQAELDRGFWCS